VPTIPACGVLLFATAAMVGACAGERVPAATFRAGNGAMARVAVELLDACGSAAPGRATAFGIWVDGQYAHEIVVFSGVGQPSTQTLIGPLASGRHAVDVRPSAFWPAVSCVRPDRVDVSVVEPGVPGSDVLNHAPVLELRADTIGEQNDLPLYAYVEDETLNGARTLRYTTVFSNEDGGTPTRALFARWGRTTDIEAIYDVTLKDGRVAREEFQGPSHEIRPFTGRRRGAAPVLLVATLNNMVTDRGRGLVLVRPVPDVVDLARGTRESTMDSRPWAWRVMTRELEREGHVVADAPLDERWVTRAPHPRDHVYLEAELTLEHAVAAAWVRDAAGQRHWSHYERASLAIDRNGWVRCAVALDSIAVGSIVEAGWACLQAPDDTAPGRCRIESSRVFVVGADGVPGTSVSEPAVAQLRAGDEVVLKRR
jgi:hypothetical protein